MSRHLITASCDPAWCRLEPQPVSLDFDGRWRVHQWHPLAAEDSTGGIETNCEHGGVKVQLDVWNLAHILDDTVPSQRCEDCWNDDTWAAMLRFVDHATRIDMVPAVTS